MQNINDHSLFLLSLNRFCYDVGRIISKKYQLSVNERNALIILSNIGINSIKELSGHLSISKTNTSKVLASLEKKKLITRVFDNDDKRFNQLSLTEQGKLMAEIVANEINVLFKHRLSEIPNRIGEKLINLIEEHQQLINYYSFNIHK